MNTLFVPGFETDGMTLRWSPPLKHFRVLMEDGSTVDVVADRDSSDWRGQLVKGLSMKIEGVALLEEM